MITKIVELAENFYALETEGFVNCHLVVGDDRAILFDTGAAAGLREEVAKITNQKLIVCHTHGDGDHIGADEEFSDIYCHPSEYDYLLAKKKLKLKAIWENELISCGDYHFRVILLPGHTPGSLAFFDENKGILLSGDSLGKNANVYMFGKGRNLMAYKESLWKLKNVQNHIRVIYGAHGDVTCDNSIIDEYIELIKKIEKGEIVGIKEMEGTLTYRYKSAGLYL